MFDKNDFQEFILKSTSLFYLFTNGFVLFIFVVFLLLYDLDCCSTSFTLIIIYEDKYVNLMI